MSEREMQDLLDLVEKTLGEQWLDISEWLRTQNSVDSIEARLRTGDFEGAIREIKDAALKFAAETTAAYVDAGQAATAWLNNQPATADELVRFDLANPYILRRAQTNELQLVHGFLDEQNQVARQLVRQTMIDGTKLSQNPLEMARRFRDAIGLTPQQQQWLESYRAALQAGDYTNALSRELSSGHSDRTIASARDAGRMLSKDQEDLAVERYRQGLVTLRANTIARTESQRNVHDGVHDGFVQAITRGDVDADELEKEWHHAGGGLHSRMDHVDMDGTRIDFPGTFNFPDGVAMAYPGDPAGGAKHTLNCRCTFSTTFKATIKRLLRRPQLALVHGDYAVLAKRLAANGQFPHPYRVAA